MSLCGLRAFTGRGFAALYNVAHISDVLLFIWHWYTRCFRILVCCHFFFQAFGCSWFQQTELRSHNNCNIFFFFVRSHLSCYNRGHVVHTGCSISKVKIQEMALLFNFFPVRKERPSYDVKHSQRHQLEVGLWQPFEMRPVHVPAKVEKGDFHAVISHFYLKHWTATQIKAEMKEVHGETAPSLKTGYYRINGIYPWPNFNSRWTLSWMSNGGHYSRSGIRTPWHCCGTQPSVCARDSWGFRHLCGESTQYLSWNITGAETACMIGAAIITIGQNRMKTDISKYCVSMLTRNPKDFWRRFVTGNETWLHHYTPARHIKIT